MDRPLPQTTQEGNLRGTQHSPAVAIPAQTRSKGQELGHELTALRNLQEVAKKRTRRTVKSQRAIVGASLDVIKERRTQRPEAREAARKAAIATGKEKKAAAESAKKANKAKLAASSARGGSRITSKQGQKGAQAKVAANTR